MEGGRETDREKENESGSGEVIRFVRILSSMCSWRQVSTFSEGAHVGICQQVSFARRYVFEIQQRKTKRNRKGAKL